MTRKCRVLLLVLLCVAGVARTQDEAPPVQDAYEGLAARQDQAPEDDSYWQALDRFRRHPINLNTAVASDWEELGLVSPVQVKAFFDYRLLLGNFISTLELQAVPGWDLATIRRVLPFITAKSGEWAESGWKGPWTHGEQSFLLRLGQTLEKSRGYLQPADSGYLGSPMHMFFRYTYNYKNLLRFGLLGDKDPGEQFFRGTMPYGFDFYSFHLYMGRKGIIKALALGDFTVSMGQGLIQWQSLAFSKGAGVLNIRRQGPAVKPYSSAGEFNFHRGIGISLTRRNWEWTGFLSSRRLDGSFRTDDSTGEIMISSLESSGYHRSLREWSGKNNISQFTGGMNISWSSPGLKLGLNGIYFHFSRPIKEADRPDNLFSLAGDFWWNESLDFSLTVKNLHLFGEFALDRRFEKAMLMGGLLSLGRTAGLSLLYRNLGPSYQALNANAFTESSNPVNEQGLYAGISFQPAAHWQMDLFFDFFQFPWLRYGADAPGYGREFFVQATYQSPRGWTLLNRFRDEGKTADSQSPGSGFAPHLIFPRRDWRTDLSVRLNRELYFRTRTELVWLKKESGALNPGFLLMASLGYNPARSWFSGMFSLQYFETGDYFSRIYIYEKDVLYDLSLPAYYGKGYSYYANARISINNLIIKLKRQKPGIAVWIRWARSVFAGKEAIGTGMDQIEGNSRSGWKIQIMVNW